MRGTFMDRPAPAPRPRQTAASSWAGTDLVANNLGVAFLQFAGLRTTTQVIARGFYVNVHEMSTPDGVGAGITCGNIIRVRIN